MYKLRKLLELLRWAEGIEYVKVNMAGNEDEIGNKYNIKVLCFTIQIILVLVHIRSKKTFGFDFRFNRTGCRINSR